MQRQPIRLLFVLLAAVVLAITCAVAAQEAAKGGTRRMGALVDRATKMLVQFKICLIETITRPIAIQTKRLTKFFTEMKCNQTAIALVRPRTI
jgi:hypothetical protein